MRKAEFRPEAAREGTRYPPPHDQPCRGRRTWPLTRAFGITQFGVNRVELAPGAWSTQRHWHLRNDETVIVVEGEVVLVTDDGEETLRAGDCVGFRAGDRNAHHLQNRSDRPAVFYDVGGNDMADISTFPDAGFEAKPRFEVSFRPIAGRQE